jgi:isoleucyl-tRNA synthetase
MLTLTIDENLKQMGVSREIVNKVQKLRKSAGLNIEDQVEIFFELPQSESVFNHVIANHLETIRTSIKVPFLEAKFKQTHHVKVAQTEYANPDNADQVLNIFICVPNVTFNE